MKGKISERTRYLFQEACLFLILSYLVLLGGTFNGLVLYSLNVTNLILVSGIGFLWILIRTVKKNVFPRTGLDIGIVIFLSAAVVSTIFSVDQRRSLISFIILVIAVLVYYLFVELIRQGLTAQLINKVLLLVSGFILFFGVRELILWCSGWFGMSGPGDLIPPATYRVSAFLGNPNFVAAYLNLLIPVGFAMIFRTKQVGSKLLLIFWMLISLILVYFTASRGGWLGTFMALGTFFFFSGIAKWGQLKKLLQDLIKKKWVSIGISLMTITGIVIVVTLMKWQLRRLLNPTDWINVLDSRGFVWVVAWDMIKAKTLIGNGLFTFGSEYLKGGSSPPYMLLTHAHNYYLNVAAEMGVIGIGSLLICVWSFIRMARNAWRSQNSVNQIELAGIFGAVAGLSAHSLFDTPQMMPLFMILPAILLAQIASGIKIAENKSQNWIGNFSLVGLWMITSVWMGLDVRALTPFNKGIKESNQENWSMAVDYFDQAVKLDSENAFYWFQDGFVSGMNALDIDGEIINEVLLNKAIFAYQKGLEIESDYSTNWMNLGLLQWAKGDRTQAIESVKLATEKSPKQGAFFLTLGFMFEKTGKIEEAKAAYNQALAQYPYWVEESYFRETPLRESVVLEWLSGIREPEIEKKAIPPEIKKDAYLVEGWALMDAGKLDLALNAFSKAPSFNNPETYLALGKTYLLLNELSIAEKNLQKALWIDRGNGWLKVNIYLSLGDLAILKEDCQGAIEYYSRAVELLERTTSYGIGKLGTSQYSWYLFYKPSIALDLLPGMENIIYTNEVIEGMYILGACYLGLGQEELAKTVYHKILFQRPDDNVATQKLAEFNGK